MKLSSRIFFASLLALLCVFSVSAQEAHEHHHDKAEQLGRVNFPISCRAATRKPFTRALALLHSFEYDEAEKAFAAVTVTDPQCGMGYWGMAMSNYHPIWTPPTPAELKKGWAAVEKAKAAGAKTGREQDYIAAIETFFKDADKLDHQARVLAYEKAMEKVHRRYPQDREAAIFYALALLEGAPMTTDKSYAKPKKAAEILNKVLPMEPQHPGVAHYIIHSYDYPELARLALPAARRYARIAPSSAHALHMPSHIFTRLGLWQDSIRSNLDSVAAAKKYAAKVHMEGNWDEELHGMDYLMYAYLQGAQDRQAKRVLDDLHNIRKVYPENFKVAYAFAAIPARYAIERRRWSEAASLKMRPEQFPWNRFAWAEAITSFARAVGAARSKDMVTAQKEIDRLASLRAALLEAGETYWAGQVEIQRQAAAAWLAHAAGKNDAALQLMRAAADLEDTTEKHPVTPGPVVPTREMLGDLLIEAGQPGQALKEYEASLVISPNRLNGLYGAARAAELSGKRQQARAYYAKLAALCRQGDGARDELQQAKAFLTKK